MKKWKPFLRMEHTSGADRKSNVRDYPSYIFRAGECVLGFSSEGTLSPEARAEFIQFQKEIWTAILEKEKRHDSRLDSRLMIPLPNSADPAKIAQAVAQIFREEGVYFALSVHAGRRGKRGVENRHIHIQFSQRSAQAGSKNRSLIAKDFLTRINDCFRAELERQGFSISQGKGKRARVPRVAYQQAMRGAEITNPAAILDIFECAIINQKEEHMEKSKEEKEREEKLEAAERAFAQGYARRVAVLSERGWSEDEILEKLGYPDSGAGFDPESGDYSGDPFSVAGRWAMLKENKERLEKALPFSELKEMERESRDAKRDQARAEEQAKRDAAHAGKNFLDQLSPEALLSFGQGDPRSLIRAIMSLAPAIPLLVKAGEKAARAAASKAKMTFQQAKAFASKVFQPRGEAPQEGKDQEIDTPGNSPAPGR